MVALNHARKLSEKPPAGCSPEEMERLGKICQSIDKMIRLLEARRQSIRSSLTPD
ncbi:MAG: hypothetical protein ACK5QT_04810 [Oligoflexia bacterium]|jgi:hypothetical protein